MLKSRRHSEAEPTNPIKQHERRLNWLALPAAVVMGATALTGCGGTASADRTPTPPVASASATGETSPSTADTASASASEHIITGEAALRLLEGTSINELGNSNMSFAQIMAIETAISDQIDVSTTVFNALPVREQLKRVANQESLMFDQFITTNLLSNGVDQPGSAGVTATVESLKGAPYVPNNFIQLLLQGNIAAWKQAEILRELDEVTKGDGEDYNGNVSANIAANVLHTLGGYTSNENAMQPGYNPNNPGVISQLDITKIVKEKAYREGTPLPDGSRTIIIYTPSDLWKIPNGDGTNAWGGVRLMTIETPNGEILGMSPIIS